MAYPPTPLARPTGPASTEPDIPWQEQVRREGEALRYRRDQGLSTGLDIPSAATTAISSLGAMPIAGWAGIIDLLRGGDATSANKAIEGANAQMITPPTPGGREALDLAGKYVFEPLEKILHAPANIAEAAGAPPEWSSALATAGDVADPHAVAGKVGLATKAALLKAGAAKAAPLAFGTIITHASPKWWSGKPRLAALGEGEGYQVRGRGIYSSVPENGAGQDQYYRTRLQNRDALPRIDAKLLEGGSERLASPDAQNALISYLRDNGHDMMVEHSRSISPTMPPLSEQHLALGGADDILTRDLREMFGNRHTLDPADAHDGRMSINAVVNALRDIRGAEGFQLRPAGSFHVWDMPVKDDLLKQWQSAGDNPKQFERLMDSLPPESRDRLIEAMEGAYLKYDSQAGIRAEMDDFMAGTGKAPSQRFDVLVTNPRKVPIEDWLDLIRRRSDAPGSPVTSTSIRGFNFQPSIPGHGLLTPEALRRALVKDGDFRNLEYMGEMQSFGSPVQNYVNMLPHTLKPLGTFASHGDFLRSSMYQDLEKQIAAEAQKRTGERLRHGFVTF